MTKPVYDTADRIADTVIRSAPRGDGLNEKNRGSWFCPCAEPRHEKLVRSLMDTYDLSRVYDLGAGDLRLSTALADDYRVVAYETNELLADYAYREHGEPDIELRTRDYYGHWAAMNHRDGLFVAIGRTNELPGVPTGRGIGLEGVDDMELVFGQEYRDRS